MKKTFSSLSVVSLLVLSIFPLRADTVAENTTGVLSSSPGFFGQSFTTVSAGPINNIAFNFFSDSPATTPTAGGTAFLLTAEYLGTPAALSAATPGYLGQAVASGGFYTFASSIILQSATQYFLYTNASFLNTGGSVYAGGQVYFTPSSGVPFSPGFLSSNFRVTGTPFRAAVPESGPTFALLLLGLLGLMATRRLSPIIQEASRGQS